ncbi:hypothetical protein [Caballeronia sp. AZ10_KS36]
MVPDCEMVSVGEINTAFRRMLANDVKYRFVIDMASMKDVLR